MIRVDPVALHGALRELYRVPQPSETRLFAVLDGQAAGAAWVDDAAKPSRCVVRETAGALTFLGGEFDAESLAEAIRQAQSQVVAQTGVRDPQAGHMHVELWPDDPRSALMPPPTSRNASIHFSGLIDGSARLAPLIAQLPGDCDVRTVDAELLHRCEWRQAEIDIFGGEEAFFEHGLGLCLMRGDEIRCETYAEYRAKGRWEVGILTREPHRGHGLATVACAHLLDHLQKRGYETVWNTSKTNEASAAVARKLGYPVERESPFLCYEPADG